MSQTIPIRSASLRACPPARVFPAACSLPPASFLWRPPLRAALRNPFIFLGLCALAAFAAALLFIWGMS